MDKFRNKVNEHVKHFEAGREFFENLNEYRKDGIKRGTKKKRGGDLFEPDSFDKFDDIETEDFGKTTALELLNSHRSYKSQGNKTPKSKKPIGIINTYVNYDQHYYSKPNDIKYFSNSKFRHRKVIE